jgi:sulfite reductase (NADPH) flavoprotein alpha-component
MNIYDRTKPFLAKVASRNRLTAPGSSKQTWHVSLDLTGSDISYRPGDCFGIYPNNDPILVERILKRLRATGCELIEDSKSKEIISIHQWLTKRANIARCSKKLLDIAMPGIEETIYNVAELLEQTTTHLTPQELVNVLSPLLPRIYSIASSQIMHPDEVHLTVSYISYEIEGLPRLGVCSHFLCDLVDLGTPEVPIYLQPTKDFLLPEDTTIPLVMIGSGTGIAPFRAFMQSRLSQKIAFANSWLFFGERQAAHDFLYEDFWQVLVNNGHLRLETAFSRDQPEKIYVQHRMWEKRKELWKLLENGANVYVCGDASRMAKDVDFCLQNVISDQANFSHDEARAFVSTLRKEKRYLRDIY